MVIVFVAISAWIYVYLYKCFYFHDFVDDYAVDPILRNDQTFLFLVTISKNKIERIELIPGLISLMQVNKAIGNDFEEITNKMIKLSGEMGTKLVKRKDRLKVVI